MSGGSGKKPAAAARHWRATQRLTLGLLCAWALLTFCSVYFARSFDGSWLGWPLSYWWAAQGGLLAYLLIALVYCWRMNELDAAFEQSEEDAHGGS